ncbi:hypothetical protein ABZ354_24770 [Streptomyces sp. NPDC005925]|uniref:hypothetical protein n=1 Tax=Streptomyces sp. NPDC005925 TaxID=3157172 RepID=UPI0033D0B822
MTWENRGPRPLGYDSATGKPAYVVVEPGGRLDMAADLFALESATVWHALASEMVLGPPLTADEANFVLACVVGHLGEVLPLAARAVENHRATGLPPRRGRYSDTVR